MRAERTGEGARNFPRCQGEAPGDVAGSALLVLSAEQYRSTPSFTEYLLVAQDQPLIEHFSRQADDAWLLREARLGGQLELPSIDCVLQVAEVYMKVFG